jgi:signal transduction histidine kinase
MDTGVKIETMPKAFYQNWNQELQSHEAEWMHLTESMVTSTDWTQAVMDIFKVLKMTISPSGRVSLMILRDAIDSYRVINSTDERLIQADTLIARAEQINQLIQMAKTDDFGILSVPPTPVINLYGTDNDPLNFFHPSNHPSGHFKALLIPFYTSEQLAGLLILECTPAEPFNRAFKTRIILIRNLLKLAVPKFNPLQQDPEHLQKILISSDKMASLGQLISGVAHELNNPVSFIESNVSFLEKYLKEILHVITIYENGLSQDSDLYQKAEYYKNEIEYEFALKDLDNIVKSFHEGAYRIKSIITSLSAFSRADKMIQEEINVHESIDNTINLLSHKARHSVIFEKTYLASPYMVANRSEINQVFMNILINAVQSIQYKMGEHSKGTVTIRTWNEDKNFFASVRDNGEGIPPSFLDKIFEPFFTTKQFGEGTGLGLSITRDIIERHHGTIQVDSQLGEGTVFTLSLPINLEDLIS